MDDLKAVNDSLGHAAGDAVLLAAARSISSCLRECDSVARLGGDEFGVLLEDVGGMGNALGSAERILAALRRPVMVGGRELVVTACIGVALGAPGVTTDQLLSNADLASFAAKEFGGDAITEFADRMHVAIAPRG